MNRYTLKIDHVEFVMKNETRHGVDVFVGRQQVGSVSYDARGGYQARRGSTPVFCSCTFHGALRGLWRYCEGAGLAPVRYAVAEAVGGSRVAHEDNLAPRTKLSRFLAFARKGRALGAHVYWTGGDGPAYAREGMFQSSDGVTHRIRCMPAGEGTSWSAEAEGRRRSLVEAPPACDLGARSL